MPHFLVRYHYTDDTAAQDVVRPRHRDFLRTLPGLLGSGPTDDNGAALVFESDSAEAVGALLDPDPFAAAGFIAERSVVGWTLVIGPWSQ